MNGAHVLVRASLAVGRRQVASAVWKTSETLSSPNSTGGEFDLIWERTKQPSSYLCRLIDRGLQNGFW